VAGHVGLELRNVDANYPFERSHRFAGIQPNSGFGDYSRLSCGVGDRQLGRRPGSRQGCLRGRHQLSSRGFPGSEPNSGQGDHSRLSCSAGTSRSRSAEVVPHPNISLEGGETSPNGISCVTPELLRRDLCSDYGLRRDRVAEPCGHPPFASCAASIATFDACTVLLRTVRHR
jgi:hypothetical protein